MPLLCDIFKRSMVLIGLLCVLLLCVVVPFSLALALSPAGKELAELLESESTQSRTVHPPYALFHAFSEATEATVVARALLDDMQTNAVAQFNFVRQRSDGLMERQRTKVRKEAGGTVDVCFRFHKRHYFKPEAVSSPKADRNDTNQSTKSDGVSPSALQLWPYFYQHDKLLRNLSALTTERVLHGVLDIDAAAFALLDEASAVREVELVLLAYNDWDAYADEALAALANFTAAHRRQLYAAATLSNVTGDVGQLCGPAGNNAMTAEEVAQRAVSMRRDGFDGMATSITSTSASTTSLDATESGMQYALLNLRNPATAEAEGALQVVGAARMAAFSGTRTRRTADFVKVHRSASPRLYFFNSHNIAHTTLLNAASTLRAPWMQAQHGITATDVHRFVHQHTSSSLMLAGKAAYHVALQLHERVLVLVCHPQGEVMEKWFASLQNPSLPSSSKLHALRQHVPFFVAQSATPIPSLQAAESAQRCLLPARRLDVATTARTIFPAAVVKAQMSTLSWSEEVLQLRMVQQRGSDSGSCMWVQPIQVPHPTSETDADFYDRAVMGSVIEFVTRATSGDGDWVVRLQSTSDFSRQLDHLLQPRASHLARDSPAALLMAVGAGSDCASMLQKVRQQEVNGRATGNANENNNNDKKGKGEEGVDGPSAYAALSARLTTVKAELDLAAEAMPLHAFHARLGPAFGAAVPIAQLEAVTARCPLYAVLRDTEAILRVDESATGADTSRVTTARSLEIVNDADVAVALIDLHRQLFQNTATGEVSTGESAAAALQSSTYSTPRTHHSWRVVLPAGLEVPLLMYDVVSTPGVPQEQHQQQPDASLTSAEPTFVLLVEKTCGVCSNYWKAFELLRRSYRRRRDGTADTSAQALREAARFVLVDVAAGFNASRAASLAALTNFSSGGSSPDMIREHVSHWQRAHDTLHPFYLSDVHHLKVPQLLLLNQTRVLATLPMEAYAEWWHWPHAVLRLMALADAQADVEATKTAMWTELSADHARRAAMRDETR